MTFIDWTQLLIFIITVILISPIMGKYMSAMLEESPHVLIPFLGWIEDFCYRSCKINPAEEMTWKTYLKNVLALNFLGFILLFLIQIIQKYLPLNPQGLPNVPLDLAFNTAASFVTNTNWQAYSGETTLSYFTQMIGLTTQNFISAATGIAVMLALVRGFKNKQTHNIGNFWRDLVRSIIYILLPFSLVIATILVSQGVIQTIKPYIEVTTLENKKQVIPVGPVASQVAIKQLGGNGGGFFGVNSAHPFENPTSLSNYFEDVSMVLIPAGLIFAFGYLVNSFKDGNLIFYVVICFWVIATCLSGIAIAQPNPSLDLSLNLEGIETRLQIPKSFFWTVTTTETSNGSTNASISSLAPLTESIAMFNMMLGECIIGGVGSGLCMMLKYVLLAVFLAGLMVGRAPEYLGKKIEKTEILWVIISLLIPSALILLCSGISYILPMAIKSISQKGPHGYTEILYAFTSAASNNGSAFKGLNADTPYFNIILGVVMIIARLSVIIPSLAIAGHLSSKRYYPPTRATLETDTILFGILLSGVILFCGALTFFPALVLGPILEHLLMLKGATF